jgi:hypothetical protein
MLRRDLRLKTEIPPMGKTVADPKPLSENE